MVGSDPFAEMAAAQARAVADQAAATDRCRRLMAALEPLCRCPHVDVGERPVDDLCLLHGPDLAAAVTDLAFAQHFRDSLFAPGPYLAGQRWAAGVAREHLAEISDHALRVEDGAGTGRLVEQQLTYSNAVETTAAFASRRLGRADGYRNSVAAARGSAVAAENARQREARARRRGTVR